MEILAYGVVGGISALVDYSVLQGMVLLGLDYRISAVLGFSFGLLCNYLLSSRFVFKGKGYFKKSAEFLVYVVIGVVGLGLTEVILYVCFDLCSLPLIVSKGVSCALVFFFNYFARKFIIYNRRGTGERVG